MDIVASAIRAATDRTVRRANDVPVDDGAGMETDDGTCPVCGAPLDAAGDCPEGDYTNPNQNTNAPTDDAGGAAASSETPPATIPAPEAKEHTVSTNPTAANTGAAPDAQSVLLAERKRASELEALARDNNVSAETLAAWKHDGTEPRDAAYQIATEKRAARQGSTPIVTGMVDRAAEQKFGSIGEQIVAIVQASKPGGRRDPRLARVNEEAIRMAGTPSGMNESVGSEGGFFVATELLPGVIEPVYTEDPILSRVFKVPSDKPSVKYQVVDETSRVTGSRWGGIQMYRVAEADTATAKKPKTRMFELNKKKIMGIGYLTEELQQDGPAASVLLTNAFQGELAFMLGDEVFRGNGAGQMQGILNSGALVSQAIEATQTIANSSTFLALNTAKMLSRIPASIQKNAIWLYNQELLPYLVTAITGTGGSAVPVFIGQGGMASQPNDTIWGRPAFPSELCEAVGTPGDLLLVVPSEFHMLADGGAQQATSLHVRFLYDESVLKITYRCDGAPIWRTSVTPYKGSNARSPFVALAARA